MNNSIDKIKHYCGIVGIHSLSERNIPQDLFFPLFSLQHRGQEGAGISYLNNGKLVTYKDLGMVSDVLGRYLEEDRKSTVGIGHVRYSTTGGNQVENVQPIQASCNKGDISIAHNGNFSNSDFLKSKLTEKGAIFGCTTDSELVLHLIAHSMQDTFYKALKETLCYLEGAFSMVMVREDNLYIMRDPMGFRPLYIGQKDGFTVCASESCALDILDITDYRSVEPGELIVVNSNGIQSEIFATAKRKAQCSFELIYFARPDSQIFDTSVYASRLQMGRVLAQQDGDEIENFDLVMSVPDSGNTAALGYAKESGLSYELGLTRNHYTGRSFILPTQKKRELAVKMKLHPVKEIVKDKRIVLVDDSLVRGTTSSIIVKLLRSAGAKEVHVRLSAPEINGPCYYGIDVPTKEELISTTKTPEEIAKHIGADSVKFLPVDKLKTCFDKSEDFCYACFNNDYPVEPKTGKDK
ncbi:amidophosphoribosyltransferase [Thiospirochaeta perfilievii]|uniref:amidophosphoribosyltransferase n=1 Tax=Thiospirochaeta perfilievii TaxID=252967 RepID=UPI001659C4ED|nr:amidophosphoribosyltransferase [Thiospirochaeta perfilievii]